MGESLIREVNVNHLFLKVVAHMTWGMSLKAAATRPGQDPLDLPLPETLAISSSLAKAMIGPQKGAIMARLERYSNGLAAPVPMGLPRLVESGWSRLGGDIKDERLWKTWKIRQWSCIEGQDILRGPEPLVLRGR